MDTAISSQAFSRSSSIFDEIQRANGLKKYSEVINRESAYEILCKKIEAAEVQQAEVQQQKAEERSAKTAPKSSSTGSTIEKQIIKTVTSATFIRGVFGVLNKMFGK